MNLQLKQVKQEVENRVNEEFSKLDNDQKQKLSTKYKKNAGISYAFGSILCIVGATTTYFLESRRSIFIFGCFLICLTLLFIIDVRKPIEKCAKLQLRKKIVNLLQQNHYVIQDDYLKNENFNIEKIIPIKSPFWANLEPEQILLFDNTTKRLVMKKGEKYSRILKYSEIQSYEIYENGSSVVEGTAGSALIGGAFFGLGGMIIGSNVDRKVSGKCNDLQLIIRINNFDFPEMTITYIDKCNIGYDKSSPKYREMKHNLLSVCSMFEFIINNKMLETQSEKEDTKTNNYSSSTKEQIKEFREMLDEGVITQAEFDQKKKQILGL